MGTGMEYGEYDKVVDKNLRKKEKILERKKNRGNDRVRNNKGKGPSGRLPNRERYPPRRNEGHKEKSGNVSKKLIKFVVFVNLALGGILLLVILGVSSCGRSRLRKENMQERGMQVIKSARNGSQLPYRVTQCAMLMLTLSNLSIGKDKMQPWNTILFIWELIIQFQMPAVKTN